MATVIAADLPALGQVPPGEHIRFVPIDYDGAPAAERQQDACFSRVRRMAELLRDNARLAGPDKSA